MAFVKQVSVDNRVNLIVTMVTDENSEYYFNSDSVAAAIQYFKLYEKNWATLSKNRRGKRTRRDWYRRKRRIVPS